MKPTSKILFFLAVLIFSAVMASECVNAENEIVLDNWRINVFRSSTSSHWFCDVLMLEIDFTQGDSALVEIDVDVVNNSKPITVALGQYIGERWSSQGNIGFFVVDSTFTADEVYSYNKQFQMTSDEWYHGTYYFLICPSGFWELTDEVIYVDVNFSVKIDYDGDGLYGSNDDHPYFNEAWISDLEYNITLNHQYIVTLGEYITNLSVALEDFEDNTSAEFASLRAEAYQVWNQVIDLSEVLRSEMLAQDDELRKELKDNVTGLRENITALQSLLSTLEIQVYEVCDSMNETTVSMGLELEGEITALSEALNTTDEWLQEVEVQLETNLASTNDRIGEVEDDMLGRLAVAKTEFNLALIELDGKEKENNDARMLEIQDAQMDIENAQEDIEDALDEARAARTVGLVTGLVGIILAIVAIVLIIRSKK